MPTDRPATTPEEQHDPQFRGLWIPAEVWYLFQAKTISLKELALLLKIDSLTREDVGCFASNRYLGEFLGIDEGNVSKTISRLKEIGLVTLDRFDGRKRFLKTAWSVSRLGQVPAPPQANSSLGASAKANLARAPSRVVKLKCGTIVPHSPVSKRRMKDTTMPIFDRTNVQQKTTPHATGCAMRLINAVKTAGKINTPYRQSSWAKHFDMLTTVDGVPPPRVTAVLDWYCANITGQYTPRAFSGQTFRTKFPAIEAAMQRTTPEIMGTPPSAIANTIAGGIIKNQWPANAKLEQLPSAVELSLQNYTEYRNRLNTHRNAPGRLGRAVVYLLETMPPPRTAVVAWWDDVYAVVHKLTSWGGAFDKFVLRHNAPRFRGMLDNWVDGYTHDAGIRRELMELISNED